MIVKPVDKPIVFLGKIKKNKKEEEKQSKACIVIDCPSSVLNNRDEKENEDTFISSTSKSDGKHGSTVNIYLLISSDKGKLSVIDTGNGRGKPPIKPTPINYLV